MDRQQLSSSSISSAGHDAATMILEVEYRNGHIYQYFDVPREYFEGLMNAPSAGAYVNTVIKPNFSYSHA